MQILIKGKQVAVLIISDEVDFRAKQITGDQERLYDDKRIDPPTRHTNSECASNNRAAKYVKEKWVGLREETDESTCILGDFSVPLLVTDRTARQNIIKDAELNNTTDQQDLNNIYRTPYLTRAGHTFF